jgi:hypothetical protein
MMRRGTYPGRLTREEWLQRSVRERALLAARAGADLLGLWKSCSKKPCRRAHACQGDESCKSRPYAADFKNPDFGRPDFKFSFRYPGHLRIPSAILDQLPFLHQPPSPETIVQDCMAEAGAKAAAALRQVFHLQRRRRARTAANR